MAAPLFLIRNSVDTTVQIQLNQQTVRSVTDWTASFYDDPANRASYADWCKENGLEYDLPYDAKKNESI